VFLTVPDLKENMMSDHVLSEAEGVEYVMNLALLEREPGHAKATLTIGPFTAFTLIGALQLATRHPEFSPDQARLVRKVIDQMRPLFAGTPGEMLLKLGDEPAFDVPRGCSYPSGPHAPECGPGDHGGFR
jgi:hypothetical protein